jgi:hypothetical protein
MKVILEEKTLNEIQSILNQFPISHLAQVQRIIEIMNSAVEKEVISE